MMDLAHIFAQLQDGSQVSSGGLADLCGYLSQWGLGAGELSLGGLAVLLAVVWMFVRIVRMLAGILFAVCILLLVLQLAGVVDASAVWELISSWLGCVEKTPQ